MSLGSSIITNVIFLKQAACTVSDGTELQIRGVTIVLGCRRRQFQHGSASSSPFKFCLTETLTRIVGTIISKCVIKQHVS